MTKKKLKVLKQALKDQKDQHDKTEDELKKALKEIEQLKQVNLEKDKKYKSLFEEKTNLEDTILKGNKPTGELKITNYKDAMDGMKKNLSKQIEEKKQAKP